MSFTYQYNVADTATTIDSVDGPTLEAEAIALGVTKAPVNPHVVRSGSVFTTTWAEDLVAAGQKGFLDAAVAAHTGVGVSPPQEVELAGPKTDDGRPKIVLSSFDAGQATVFRGIGDDHATGTRYADGEEFRTIHDNASALQYKNVDWELRRAVRLKSLQLWWDCRPDAADGDWGDYVIYLVRALATPGVSNPGAGSFDNVAGKWVPEVGGDWDLDLTTTKTPNVSFTAASPVTNPRNTGHFDYNCDTNELSVNAAGAGAYDLYDGVKSAFFKPVPHFSLIGQGSHRFEWDGVPPLILPHWLHRLRIYKAAALGEIRMRWLIETGDADV